MRVEYLGQHLPPDTGTTEQPFTSTQINVLHRGSKTAREGLLALEQDPAPRYTASFAISKSTKLCGTLTVVMTNPKSMRVWHVLAPLASY